MGSSRVGERRRPLKPVTADSAEPNVTPGGSAASTSSASFLLGPDSEATPALSVVIPTLNEERGIGQCIEDVIAALEELHVPGEIIISDSSTDRTPEIAERMGAIVVEPDEPGYGYAYRYAFRHARGKFLVIGDADTTYDFTQIPRLLEHLVETDADIVMGSRLEGEIEPGAMPALHQYVGNPLLTRFLNGFYDAGVTDAHSGFRVIRREVLSELELRTDGMEFASEMVMSAAARDLRIEEVPITYHERTGEATLESFRDGWRHVKFMLVNAPNYLFSVPGGIWMLVGLSLMAASYLRPEVWGISLGILMMVAGSMIAIVGSQVWSLGVFSTVASDPILAPRDPVTRWIADQVRMKHGMGLGSGLVVVGASLAGVAGFRYAVFGHSAPFILKGFILSFTVVVFGILVVFQSFFLSLVRTANSAK